MGTTSKPLECRALSIEWKTPLLAFLTVLEDAKESAFFYPHPFSEEALEQIIQRSRRDLYYVLCEGHDVLGYGLLRGWDEGYEIPSLGIAIHPAARCAGLGRAFMHFLHAAARHMGATKVRLRVNSQNSRGLKLYQDLGYVFSSEESGYLVGFVAFRGSHSEVESGVPQG